MRVQVSKNSNFNSTLEEIIVAIKSGSANYVSLKAHGYAIETALKISDGLRAHVAGTTCIIRFKIVYARISKSE